MVLDKLGRKVHYDEHGKEIKAAPESLEDIMGLGAKGIKECNTRSNWTAKQREFIQAVREDDIKLLECT